jgi:hypothetical protein
MVVYGAVLGLLVGIVALDLVAMRWLAPQRVAGTTGGASGTSEAWDEYRRIAAADPARLNPTQRRLVDLGGLRRRATDVETARRLEDAMDRLVNDHRRHLS